MAFESSFFQIQRISVTNQHFNSMLLHSSVGGKKK